MSTRYATIETNRGTLVAELFDRDCPDTVEAFVRLANAGRYDGMRLASPGGGTLVEGAAMAIEDDEALVPVETIGNRNKPVPGALALGRRGDRGDASRLYFVVGAGAGRTLEGEHTVFGWTDDGIEVMARLGSGDTVRRIRVRD